MPDNRARKKVENPNFTAFLLACVTKYKCTRREIEDVA